MADPKLEHSDIAAIGGAFAVILLETFKETGPFTLVSTAISAMLVVTIFGYVWSHVRSKIQAVAVAAMLALTTVPLWGFVIEVCTPGTDVKSLLLCGNTISCNLTSEDGEKSKVFLAYPLIPGLFVFLFACFNRFQALKEWALSDQINAMQRQIRGLQADMRTLRGEP